MKKKKENKETKRDSFVYDETQNAFAFKGIKAFENTYDTTFIHLNSGEDVSVSQLIKVYEESKKMHTSENVTLVGSDFVNNLTFQITDDCDPSKVKFIRNNTEDVTLDVLLALYDKYKANDTIDISNENDGKCKKIDLAEPPEGCTWGINISPIANWKKYFINIRSSDEKTSQHLYFNELIAAYKCCQTNRQKLDTNNTDALLYIIKYINVNPENENKMADIIGRDSLENIKTMYDVCKERNKDLALGGYCENNNSLYRNSYEELIQENTKLKGKVSRAKMIFNSLYGTSSPLFYTIIDEDISDSDFYSFITNPLFIKLEQDLLIELRSITPFAERLKEWYEKKHSK